MHDNIQFLSFKSRIKEHNNILTNWAIFLRRDLLNIFFFSFGKSTKGNCVWKGEPSPLLWLYRARGEKDVKQRKNPSPPFQTMTLRRWRRRRREKSGQHNVVKPKGTPRLSV